MFYNHTVLTSRKHGVAVVWLMATLGSQISSKKVDRQKILDVNIHQACQTIQSTHAPLALRLQGNLLFGVASVHSRQCGYVLADLRAMRDKIKGVEMVLKELGLDPEAGKARPDQLNLPHDAAFLPDLDFNFDFPALSSVSSSSSGRSSLMSPSSLRSSHSSLADEDDDHMEDLALDLSSVDASIGADFGGMLLAPGMSPGFSSGAVIPGPALAMEEDTGIEDLGYEFDEDGNIVETGAAQEPVLPTTAAPETPPGNNAPQSAVRAATESDIGVEARASYQPESSFNFDDGLLAFGDDERLPPGGSLPPSGTPEINDDHPTPPADEVIIDQEISSTVATVPHRRVRAPRPLGVDTRAGLTNAELKQWDQCYLENMAQASTAKVPFRAMHQAKKNAPYWVFEHGIGGVGARSGDDRVGSPLHMFAGDALLASLVGDQVSTGGRKHARSSSSDSLSEEEERRVRQRGEDEEEQQIGRGGSAQDLDLSAQDDGIAIGGDDDLMEIEVGRDAPPQLADDDRSSMPWDIYSNSRAGSVIHTGSAAAGGISSSIGGPGRGFDPGLQGSSISRRGSRLTSASPLQGRGLPLSHRISIIATPEGARRARAEGDSGDDEMLLGGPHGLDDDSADFQLPVMGSMDDDDEMAHAAAAAAAGDEVQDAEQQRWGVAAALDSETRNFLDFLDAKIQSQRVEAQETAEEDVDESNDEAESNREQSSTTTTFSALLPPAQHSKSVAATAFLDVLSLASKNLVSVRQEQPEFGEIELGIMIEA